MFSTSLHTVKLQFILLFKAARRKCLEGVRIWNATIVSSLVMNKGSSSEKWKTWSGMALLSAGYYLTHFSFLHFYCFYSFKMFLSLSIRWDRVWVQWQWGGRWRKRHGWTKVSASQMYKDKHKHTLYNFFPKHICHPFTNSKWLFHRSIPSSIINIPGESTLRRDFLRLQLANKERSEAQRRQQLEQQQNEEHKRLLLAERQKRIEEQKEQRRRLEEVSRRRLKRRH